MVIWILDYQTGECVKVNGSCDKIQESEMDEWYPEIEEWLQENEEELGIRLSYCYWMVTNNDEVREINKFTV